MSSPALSMPLALPQQETNRLPTKGGETSREHDVAELNRQQINQDDIARLAYALWQRRGCPDGSAEMDWLEAETQLLK
jgi:Protein of unknown function (DUF2934)